MIRYLFLLLEMWFWIRSESCQGRQPPCLVVVVLFFFFFIFIFLCELIWQFYFLSFLFSESFSFRMLTMYIVLFRSLLGLFFTSFSFLFFFSCFWWVRWATFVSFTSNKLNLNQSVIEINWALNIHAPANVASLFGISSCFFVLHLMCPVWCYASRSG